MTSLRLSYRACPHCGGQLSIRAYARQWEWNRLVAIHEETCPGLKRAKQ